MLEKFHGWRSLVGYRPWDHKELARTEQHHFHFPLSCIGKGNGNPLQCSCLENPRDGGAWWAAICGVAQSLSRLSDFTLHGVREFSDFILLLIADQFSQHHLLEGLSFLLCIFLPPLSKIRCPEVHGFVWAFYLVPLVYISGFVPVQFWCDDCSFVIRHTLKLILVINIFNHFFKSRRSTKELIKSCFVALSNNCTSQA